MDPTLQHVLNEDLLIPIAFITLGSLTAIIWIISATIHAVAVARAREQTKRELAAYVAEGSLDPDKAVALINAGRKKSDSADESKSC